LLEAIVPVAPARDRGETTMKSAIAIAGSAGVLLLAGACSSAVPTDTPGVERAGATVLLYKGPDVEAALGYRFAASNLGTDWLMLDLAATATHATVEVKRDRISLRTPQGETVPLATQQEFGQAYGKLRADIERANVAADPLDYFPRGRAPCTTGFFTVPGEGLAFPSVWLDDRRVCAGRLFFAVPGGVQEGTYTLAIDFEESRLRIPFRLGGQG
jgi:hypothetical protein